MPTGLVMRSSSDENSTTMATTISKPKPLQASTNIIHTKIPRRIDNLIHNKAGSNEQPNEPIKKKIIAHRDQKPAEVKLSHTPKVSETSSCKTEKKSCNKTSSQVPVDKVDENVDIDRVKFAYNPLHDIHFLQDEELYQKILKLDLADNGFPCADAGEPFDF